MIAQINGVIKEIWKNFCVVSTSGGVGYEIALPAHTLAELPAIGESVSFYTSLVVREDAMELFGFSTFAERQTFEILIEVSKVGARTALAILSIFRPEELARVVMDDDIGALTKVSGIGKKTAQHILLELKYKLSSIKAGQRAPDSVPLPSVYADTLAALENLGYDEEECGKIIRDILAAEPDLDVSSAIRGALKAMAKGK